MSESSPPPPPQTHSPATSTSSSQNPEIPIEIVSDEEMALIEAAFAATRRAHFPPTRSLFQQNARSIRSITLLSKRILDTDMEDAAAGSTGTNSKRPKLRRDESLLYRFRRKRGLSVTDITSTEWCEKQMEFMLLVSRPEATKAMKAGSARHAVLEEEVIKRVKVQVRSVEDDWAIKIMNFMVGVNQLVADGLTRELPLVGFVEGIWMVGVVDEIRIPLTKNEKHPTFIDTKTREKSTVPSEPQQRNGRLQLMCYKYLWDTLVCDKFPSTQFFESFSLNRHSILSEDVREITRKSGFSSETLDDLLQYFQNICSTLSPAHDQLILRYESQKDHSILGETKLDYDSKWVKTEIKSSLEFWLGERKAQYAPEEERWKCKYCQFSSFCPINSISKDKDEQD